jgi:hypothetical protein
LVHYRITSKYGAAESFRDHTHRGVDLSMPEGTSLRAIENGTIRIKDYGGVNSGKTVFIDTEDGKTIIYGHLHDFAVRDGQRVNVGDLLGHSGNTGHSTGSHLHLGVKDHGEFIDPTPYASLIESVGKTAKQVGERMIYPKLEAASMFNDTIEQLNGILSEMTLNFIHILGVNLLHAKCAILPILETILPWIG